MTSPYYNPTIQMPSPNEYNATCHLPLSKVESILDSQIFQGKFKYLICWKGYSIEEDKWRPSEDVKGVKRLVTEFHWRDPEAP